jgi:very-short-patch-repair endonuclease
VNFRRQHAIGSYVVDFCSPKHKLIIELDGSQHLDQGDYDTERTAFLKSRGYRVLRFWNYDVVNGIDGVLHVIEITLEENSEVI